jgi:hypothetical protein
LVEGEKAVAYKEKADALRHRIAECQRAAGRHEDLAPACLLGDLPEQVAELRRQATDARPVSEKWAELVRDHEMGAALTDDQIAASGNEGYQRMRCDESRAALQNAPPGTPGDQQGHVGAGRGDLVQVVRVTPGRPSPLRGREPSAPPAGPGGRRRAGGR